jgi:hypothetical protein
MKQKGRSVIPWFETCYVIALSLAITASVFAKLIFSKYKNLVLFDNEILLLFLLVGIGVFFLVKSYYFKNDKHIKLMEIYIERYSPTKRNRIRYTVTIGLTLLPFFFMFIMWLQESTTFWQGF